jgi:hypothetical protein
MCHHNERITVESVGVEILAAKRIQSRCDKQFDGSAFQLALERACIGRQNIKHNAGVAPRYVIDGRSNYTGRPIGTPQTQFA